MTCQPPRQAPSGQLPFAASLSQLRTQASGIGAGYQTSHPPEASQYHGIDLGV